MEKIDELKKIIDESKNIVFFGGAGVSTESGIPDFRSQDGLYNQQYDYSPERILSHTFFEQRPDLFYKFYKDKMLYLDALPNACHKKLAQFEQAGKLSAIITQNIDELHQLAGSEKVIELHGSVYNNYCTRCGKEYSVDYIIESNGVPLCSCGGIIKPNVVLYEEQLNEDAINEAVSSISRCDTLIIGGTSLQVFPANSLIHYFNGKNLVLINKEKLDGYVKPDLFIQGSIGEVFSKL